MNLASVQTSRVLRGTSSELAQFERVLVPIDFTVPSEQAIAHAYASVRSGGEVHLLHVAAPNDRNEAPPREHGNGDGKHRELSARLQALIPESAESRGITTQPEVLQHYEPVTAICQAADRLDADLICMESRGRSRLKEMILGSVSQEVMTRSDRPVFVIPGTRGRTH
jgi:nucleotide-binding universal stress UspA family protein